MYGCMGTTNNYSISNQELAIINFGVLRTNILQILNQVQNDDRTARKADDLKIGGLEDQERRKDYCYSRP